MVAVPLPTAVTIPLLFTVATEVLLDFQVTFLQPASVGAIVAVNVTVAPLLVNVAVVLFKLTLVGFNRYLIFTFVAEESFEFPQLEVF